MIYHPSVCSKPSELGDNVRGLWASFAAAIVGALECGGGSMSQKEGGEPTVEAEVYGEVSLKRYFRKGESFLLAMLVLNSGGYMFFCEYFMGIPIFHTVGNS